MKGKNKYRFILAGGGTGGHIYPAIAVAEKIRELLPDAEITFIGTKNKIESRAVPKAGFNFRSIWISGLMRKLTLSNLLFPVKLVVAIGQALGYCLKYKPRVVIGTGAYVSGPVVWVASLLGSKVVLLEQNSFPGKTNRMLESKANEIHIAFDESRKYFKDGDKLLLSGNPVRINMKLIDKKEALVKFDFESERKTLFVFGGSLGARDLNIAMKNNLHKFVEAGMQIIWQTGSLYYDQYKELGNESVKVVPFVDDMSAAYSAADLIVARAGATTIAEVAYLGLPVLFVPSRNVAANHQYKNAMALENDKATVVVKDSEVSEKIFDVVSEVINDEKKLNEIKENIKKFSKPDAAEVIAKRVISLAEEKK